MVISTYLLMAMTISFKVTKNKKQKTSIGLIVQNTFSLLEGGSRSGKTFIILYAIILRALKYPGTRHLIARFRFSHVKIAICYDTMPKVLECMGLRGRVTLNKTDWYYECPNGSTIWVGGLDDKDRTEKILGNEYATIFLNEASQISFDSFEMLITRLNAPRQLEGKIIIDYNPPSIMHWGYRIFHKREFPDGRPVPEDDYQFIKINPIDNQANISKTYLDNLKNLSASKRKRFLEGDYSLDSGKLFRRSWIQYAGNDALPEFAKIVVGVDPSGSVGGDEIGIVVSGEFVEGDTKKYMVLDDYSLHGTPKQWAAEVASAYRRWEANYVVAEKNYGGDMVGSTIENAQPGIPVQLITSSRGKVLRAEPVSALYEKNLVKHRIPFSELEDEMCTFDPDISESPNRMDALVFSISSMAAGGLSMLDVL